MMVSGVAWLCLISLAALLVWAAAADLRRYVIPNRISIAILAVYLLYASAAGIFPSPYTSINWFGGLIVGGSVLIVGAFLFAKGLFGGGDVKLLASTAVWAGPAMVVELIAITAIVGGLLAAGILAHRAIRRPACAGPNEDAGPPPLPYGFAIAVGGLYVVGRLAEGWLDAAQMI